MEDLKKKGVTHWIGIIKAAYFYRENQHVSWYAGYLDRRIDGFIADSASKHKRHPNKFSANPFSKDQIKEFINWVLTDEGEVWFAQKSPSNAVKLAVANRKRLGSAAEKFILEKAKDRGSLLEYCSTFGIVLPNMEKVTLKAAFDDKSSHEKRYIKHIEETKKKVKDFLSQLVNINQVDPETTIKKFLESV